MLLNRSGNIYSGGFLGLGIESILLLFTFATAVLESLRESTQWGFLGLDVESRVLPFAIAVVDSLTENSRGGFLGLNIKSTFVLLDFAIAIIESLRESLQ